MWATRSSGYYCEPAIHNIGFGFPKKNGVYPLVSNVLHVSHWLNNIIYILGKSKGGINKCWQKGEKNTHQAHEQKENKECTAQNCFAVNISVAHSGHGHNKKVHTCPIGQLMFILEIKWITWVFQLKKKKYIRNKIYLRNPSFVSFTLCKKIT